MFGTEATLYQRECNKVWEKSVELLDVRQQPSNRYMKALLAAGAVGDMEEFDQLTPQEVEQTLYDVRTKQA